MTQANLPPVDLRGAPLDDVLDFFQVPEDADALMVGDGSGQRWTSACGWAVTVIDLFTKQRELVLGAWSHGTSQVAEVVPYFQALWWYHAAGPGAQDLGRALTGTARERHIHVVSDNENVVKQGRGDHKRKKNAPAWAGIDQLCRMGNYQLHFHFVGRDVLDLNALADHAAREAARALNELTPAALFPGLRSLGDVTPG